MTPVVLALAMSVWANVAQPVFQRVDLSQIGNPSIYAVAQDRQGFIWIGTPTGLLRYDGYQFRRPTAQSSGPAPSNVESLVDDGRGSLWIGTQSNGLERLDEKTETFHAWPVDPKGRRGPRSATIIALAHMPGGAWLIGGDSGLDRFDPVTQTFAPVPLDTLRRTAPRVEAVHVDGHGGVWVGTVRGLYYRAAGATGFSRLPLGGNDRAAVFSLYEDEGGRMWAGSINAVYVLSPAGHAVRAYRSTNDPASLAPGEQWAIAEVGPGSYWIGTSDGGIAILDYATQRLRRVLVERANPGGLTPGEVWQFFRDRSGLLWIPNDTGGLLIYNPYNGGTYALPSYDKGLGFSDLGVRTVAAAADGALWVGGGDSIVHLDPRAAEMRTYSLSASPSVQALYADADGTLWIGTARGLCVLRRGAAAIECPSGIDEQIGRVFTIIGIGSTLWVGTDSGVVAWDRSTGAILRYRHAVRPDSISNDFIESLYRDRRGYVWVGTASGLNRIDPRTHHVLRFAYDPNDANALGPGQMYGIVEDDLGRIWAGAVGGPLNMLDRRGERYAIRRLKYAEIPQDVDGLEKAADGSIWASASDALVRIDPRTFGVTSFGPAQGVQQSAFWPRPSRGLDGTLFFAGSYSVIAIAPGAGVTWNYAPPLVVTAVKVGQRDVPPSAFAGSPMLQLAPGQRDLSVEFAALDYSAPQTVRYQYRLDGFDGAWNSTDATHRVATYTNLAPGTYMLHVRGTNRAGVWIPSAIALKIRALPAWYETWWFRALLALLGIFALYGFVRARTAVLRRQAERLEALVEERTHELAQANATLEKMTVVDSLTGLHNRRFLLQRIDEEVELAVRQGTDLLFFIVDIDHFKAVNDEFGHQAGDRVLEQMRERLEEVFRASDYVLRWGGEEFLAVTRGSPRDDAPGIAERLRVAIGSRPFLLDGEQPLPKTASIGFAAFPFVRSQPHAISWTQVVDLADHALYMAKHGGRDQWYGLAASAETDPARLSEKLAASGEFEAHENRLTIICKGATGADEAVSTLT